MTKTLYWYQVKEAHGGYSAMKYIIASAALSLEQVARLLEDHRLGQTGELIRIEALGPVFEL